MEGPHLLRILVLAVTLVSCQDRLAFVQRTCQGTWELQSRELSDGTILLPPDIFGSMHWKPIDQRKAHVSLLIIVEGEDYRLDHSASTYEVSTSAITRKRHFLIKRGYRQAEIGLQSYSVEKTRKGKLSIEEDDSIVMTHLATPDDASRSSDQVGFKQIFQGDTMIASYQEAFKDTWKKVASSSDK